MKTQTIEGLNTLVDESENHKATHAIIFLHGYGADASDLAPLRRVIRELWHQMSDAPPTTFYFPHAPIALGMGGRAWFPLPDSIMRQIMSGAPRESMRGQQSDEFEKAKRQLQGFVNFLKKSHGEISVVGFSQGGMLASHLIDRVNRCVLLSAALVAAERLPKLESESINQVRVIQSHGRRDPILPLWLGEELHQELEKQLGQFMFNTFDGEHTISPHFLGTMAQFLAKTDL